jgi:hypothetical protein
MDAIPKGLGLWLEKHGAGNWVAGSSKWPGTGEERRYVLATADFGLLSFEDHSYNPRKPSDAKINLLLASVRQLSMLSPITCAFIEGQPKEPVVLIDGRHRFSALQKLAAEEPDWAKKARIDLKVFYGLQKSDLHVLATYLNRTRQKLSKGEYYRAIVNIYDEKLKEMEATTGTTPLETEVFSAINARELSNHDPDLSIGRIVGITAFDEEEEGSWYPLVGMHQHEKFIQGNLAYYRPLTAGNLAEFLTYLCLSRPYKDRGESRAVEIGNVVTLGEAFREIVLTQPIKDRKRITQTTVACKFWCLAAFGDLLKKYKSLPEREAPFSAPDLDWDRIRSLLKAYSKVMKDQAKVVSEYKDTKDPEFLNRAWSYQTQKDQVRVPLKKALVGAGFSFRKD